MLITRARPAKPLTLLGMTNEQGQLPQTGDVFNTRRGATPMYIEVATAYV